MTQIYQYKLLYKFIIQSYYRFVKRFLRFSYIFLLIFSICLKGAPTLVPLCKSVVGNTPPHGSLVQKRCRRQPHPMAPLYKERHKPPNHSSLVQRELSAQLTEGLSCLFSVPKTLFDRSRYLTINFPNTKKRGKFPALFTLCLLTRNSVPER